MVASMLQWWITGLSSKGLEPLFEGHYAVSVSGAVSNQGSRQAFGFESKIDTVEFANCLGGFSPKSPLPPP